MNFDKSNIDNLIRSLLNFKDEELTHMSIDDHKHPLHFDKYSQKNIKKCTE